MDNQNQNEMARAKGYSYLLKTDGLTPFYVKTMADVCRVMRELYPNKRFTIIRL